MYILMNYYLLQFCNTVTSVLFANLQAGAVIAKLNQLFILSLN